MYQRLDDPIDVVVVFERNRGAQSLGSGTRPSGLRPIRFRWKGSSFHIKEITGRWQTRVGTERKLHFSTLDQNSNFFQLSYDLSRSSWHLTKIYLD
ncbi:MAG: hypothetical protein IIB00_05650 [candidate division Zixibacteria bacterium]|nr:hypothetical protein [candidate division Zixibacteria bacterium]